MKSKVFKEVYGEKEFCSDAIEVYYFEKVGCQYYDKQNIWCQLHHKSLDLKYIASDDPDIEGSYPLKLIECLASITDHDDQSDKLFITELINDLHRNGFIRGGKAETMLHDWSRELKHRASTKHPASRLRKTFNLIVGKENW